MIIATYEPQKDEEQKGSHQGPFDDGSCMVMTIVIAIVVAIVIVPVIYISPP